MVTIFAIDLHEYSVLNIEIICMAFTILLIFLLSDLLNMDFRNSSSFNFTNKTCSNEAWLVFPITYITVYLLGISLSFVVFSVGRILSRNATGSKFFITQTLSMLHRIKQFARSLRSGDTLQSRVMISAVFLCNLAYMILAIQRTFHSDTRCFDSLGQLPDLVVEVAITPLLIIFFLIRLLSTDNILLFWFKMHTIIDLLTLPNIFIFIHLRQDWIATNTLRFIWLTQVIEVLHFLPTIHSQVTIEAIDIVTRLLALWLGATGLIHMLETMGDPWNHFTNKQNSSYLEYAYFIIVTLSTVGYGDYTAMTDIGRLFMVILIIVGIAFFAVALPNLVDIIISYHRQTQWKKFDTTRVPRHVLVCGNLTATIASNFLKDFLHKDRGDRKTHVLLMHTDRPDENLRLLLRSYYPRVQYVIGSVLNPEDLTRAKVNECLRVFILARKHCRNPQSEDHENLLRLVSIKNNSSSIPVTIQVLLSSSKEKVKHINFTASDTIVCISELKLGLLAQSCVCPGFSTLVSNLFYVSGAVRKVEGWQKHYSLGLSREIYITHFSQAFDGMSFYDAATICYENLGLVLIAVEDRESGKFYISPSPSAHPHLQIRSAGLDEPQPVMLGYFIGENQNDVNKVSLSREKWEMNNEFRNFFLQSKHSPQAKRKSLVYCTVPKVHNYQSVTTSAHDNQMFHVTYPRPIEECIISDKDTSNFHNHILVCIFATDISSALNLRNFLEPLRKKTIADNDLMPVTIISKKEYLEKEWSSIDCFSHVNVVIGNPLDWNILSLAGVDKCRVCVILTAYEDGAEALVRDKEVILCLLMIHNHYRQSQSSIKPPFIVADISEETNVHFLDFEKQTQRERHMHLTQTFACGEILASSFFDSITSSTLHIPGNIFIIEQLIAGLGSKYCQTQSSIQLVPLQDLGSHETLCTFQQLYTYMLEQHKTVVAISRLFQPHSDVSRRYIVTAPPPDSTLHSSDYVLVLEEYQQ